MRILHVVECYEAGAGHVVNEITKLTPGVEHHLLFEGSDDPDELGSFDSAVRMRGSVRDRCRDVADRVKELSPVIIHGHSSWAGLYTRVRRLGVPVVYQPHCYAFEDPSRGLIARSAIRGMEILLARQTCAVVAVSPRELNLAQRMNSAVPARLVPNPPTVAKRNTERQMTDPEVVMIGRISPQKDPSFFAAASRECADSGMNVSFVWVGDGDAGSRRELQEAGVRVTGWLSSDKVTAELDKASAYLHSARYEGFPLSIINAAARRLPIIVREIPAFDGAGLTSVSSVDEAVKEIGLLHKDAASYERGQLASARLTAQSDPRTFAGSIELLYQEVENAWSN